MMLGRVIGNVVATVKDARLEGRKLLLVQPIGKDGSARGRVIVALDAAGAGYRETVYWCRGREAALAFATTKPVNVEELPPIDAAVVGIVDSVTQAKR